MNFHYARYENVKKVYPQSLKMKPQTILSVSHLDCTFLDTVSYLFMTFHVHLVKFRKWPHLLSKFDTISSIVHNYVTCTRLTSFKI